MHDASRPGRHGPWWVALASLVGCTFVPPPPLAGEEEAAGAVHGDGSGAAKAGASGASGEPASSSSPQAEPEGADGEPTAAEGDPTGGRFDLAAALAGLEGSGRLWAVLETERGPLVCELFEDRAPITVANFVGLARGLRPFRDPTSGAWTKRPFYDGTIFHRVIPGFMIQGGDPTGTGTGGAGYTIPDEIHPDLEFDEPGRLAMAGRGPNTASSQFFVTLAPAPHLDGQHTIFGQCTPDSVALADDMAMVPRDADDRPKEPERLLRVSVVRGEAPPRAASGSASATEVGGT